MKELIAKLEKLGFTTYESKVFLVLYQGYAMSAAEVAKEAKIPRPSVYEILRNFAKQGYCNEIHTPTKQIYEIIDTNVIEGKLELDASKAYQSQLINIKGCFNDLKPLFKSKKGPEYITDVELIKGFNRRREQKFIELIKSSTKAILVMNRFDGTISVEADEESKRFYKRGGVVKSIYESNGNFKLKINNKIQNVTKEGLLQLCEEFAKHGEEIRFLNEVPQIMAVFDESIVYISLFDETMKMQDMSDIIIKNKRFASFVTGLFNTYWDKADTLDILKKQINNNN